LRLHYCLWQIHAYFVATKLHNQIYFDLAHHATIGAYWLPTFLAFLPIPFIWGPVAGGDRTPRSFFSELSRRGKLFEWLRGLLHAWTTIDPFVRLAARRSAAILACTPETTKRFPRTVRDRVMVAPQVGVSQDEFGNVLEGLNERKHCLRIISVGRLLHWKGFSLGLKAFARYVARLPRSQYWIVGEGPEKKRLQQLALALDISDKVTFWGAIPWPEVQKCYRECDIFLHPTFCGAPPTVCVEAMAAGLPVVCLDLATALHVTEETGIKVSAITPKQALVDLAAALVRLAEKPVLRAHLGEAGRRRVEAHYRWDKYGDHLNEIYKRVKNGPAGRLDLETHHQHVSAGTRDLKGTSAQI
jgi:glycosyltransferase involved in cell wall biosynthesis